MADEWWGEGRGKSEISDLNVLKGDITGRIVGGVVVEYFLVSVFGGKVEGNGPKVMVKGLVVEEEVEDVPQGITT